MGIFNETFQINNNGEIVHNQWIEWNHFLIPNKPKILRKVMRKIMAFLGHCKKCTSLDGGYLLKNKSPKHPIHPNCDCNKIDIKLDKVKKNAVADLPIIKLSKYIFNGDSNSKGKQSLFLSWGYTANDVFNLKNIFESQAKENYTNGNYALKNLDDYGQRLSIPINLQGEIFNSGWMLCPEGRIRNITPFGGWIK